MSSYFTSVIIIYVSLCLVLMCASSSSKMNIFSQFRVYKEIISCVTGKNFNIYFWVDPKGWITGRHEREEVGVWSAALVCHRDEQAVLHLCFSGTKVTEYVHGNKS